MQGANSWLAGVLRISEIANYKLRMDGYSYSYELIIDGWNELITAYGLTVVKCLKIVDFKLKKLAMELRDGRLRLRAVNGWLDMVRT